VNETNSVAIPNKPDFIGCRVIVGLITGRIKEPVIVRIFVVITCNLLLTRALGVRLDVRVKKSSPIPHVLEGRAGTNGNLEWAISQIGTLEVSLEKGAHLSIARTGVLENDEVSFEACHVDKGRYDNKPKDTCDPVACINMLYDSMSEVTTAGTLDGLTTGIFRSPNLFHRSSTVYSPITAVTKSPTHLTLQTHPQEIPERINQANHSTEKGFFCKL
jgi:hypothetical protein